MDKNAVLGPIDHIMVIDYNNILLPIKDIVKITDSDSLPSIMKNINNISTNNLDYYRNEIMKYLNDKYSDKENIMKFMFDNPVNHGIPFHIEDLKEFGVEINPLEELKNNGIDINPLNELDINLSLTSKILLGLTGFVLVSYLFIKNSE
jgi:hypothetical protein